MILFTNATGRDEDWVATAITNAVAVAVYLTDEDKEAIARMTPDTRVLAQARPLVSPAQCHNWTADLRAFGDKAYRDAALALATRRA